MIKELLFLVVYALSAGSVTTSADLGDNLRYSVDVSSSVVKTGESDPLQLAFVGLDLHKVYSLG